jgi:hypothetical protein
VVITAAAVLVVGGVALGLRTFSGDGSGPTTNHKADLSAVGHVLKDPKTPLGYCYQKVVYWGSAVVDALNTNNSPVLNEAALDMGMDSVPFMVLTRTGLIAELGQVAVRQGRGAAASFLNDEAASRCTQAVAATTGAQSSTTSRQPSHPATGSPTQVSSAFIDAWTAHDRGASSAYASEQARSDLFARTWESPRPALESCGIDAGDTAYVVRCRYKWGSAVIDLFLTGGAPAGYYVDRASFGSVNPYTGSRITGFGGD